MQGEVQLIVTVGATEYVDNGLWTIDPSYFVGQTSWNINSATAISNPVPSNSFFTIGTIIAMDPIIGGLVETCVVTSFDSLTGDITTNVGLDFTNLSPIPVTATARISTLVDTTTQNYLDLFENESISQNWKFQDLSNFTAQGAFTREFRIPYSENNQLALGALFDVNVTAGSANYFHYKLPAEIRVDTLPISTGYVRVRKVYRTLNRINEVEIAFYAETPDLVRNIGEKKLADIADLTTLDEIVQYQNVTNPSATRIWTICDRGQLWSEGGEVNTRSLTTTSTPVWAADLTPALSWWYLFEQIVTEAGFELVAGTLENIMSNYWMPWLNSQRIIGSDSFNDNLWSAYNSASLTFNITPTLIPINTEVFDNGGDFNPATYTYTTPTDGYYTFRLTPHLTVSTGTNIFLYLLIDGVEIFIDNFFVNAGSQVIDTTYRIGIDAGSSVQFKIANQTATSVTLNAGNGTYNASLFQLAVTEFNFNQTIYYNLNAPDMKQIDFVTDVIKMHNCAIVPDRTNPNKLYVVPQNSYLGSGDVLDWTSKLDTSKDIVLSSTVDLQRGKFQFSYTTGEDIFSQQYKNVNRVYGDYEVAGYTINPDTAPSDFAIGDQKIQLVTRSLPAGVVNGSGYVIPMFFDSSLRFKVPGPHCLFEAGSYAVALYNDNTSAVVTTNVSTLNHYSVINADIDDEDLNFAPEVPPHPIVTNPFNNLFNTYWRSYMNSLYNPDARIMEAFFALDLKDVLTFSFSDKVWIQDTYWRILEINDYKVGLQESTKVTLLKFLDDQEDCFSTPVSVSINGEVNFEDANGDPVASTQDCCVRYGYDWDEVNAICWAFSPTGDRPNTATSGTPTNPSPRPTTAALQNRSVLNSVITGNDVTIATGNSNMLAVGNRLELDEAVSGSNLLGKNVYTKLPGIHLGGGWKNGNTSSAEKGWAQSGDVILHYKDAWVDSQIWDLLVEGVPASYIEIPDDSVWSCLMKATIVDSANNICTGQYVFQLSKFAGAAQKIGVITLDEQNGTAYTFTFDIDTATNPTQHRVNLQVTGLGVGTDTFIVTASIQYQQSTIA